MRFVGRLLVVLLAGVSSTLVAAGAAVDPGGGELDGFVIEHVPERAGDMVSDFEYRWGEVAFSARVWERAVEGDGYRVDLQVLILRGERLEDLTALRDFLAEYHERDPEQWQLSRFRNGEYDGLIGDSEAFWLVEPGLAAEVRLASDRLGAEDLRATARGVRPAGP